VDDALRAQGDIVTTFDVVLMAPASTMDFYSASYAQRVRGVRIFQMTDAIEKGDHLMSKDFGPGDPSVLGKVYPQSLLYLVSGICETFDGNNNSGPHLFDENDMPILGMDRYFAEVNVYKASDYPSVNQARNNFVVAPPAGPSKFVRVLSSAAPILPSDGYQSGAQKHGNFPGDEATIGSIRVCFQHGL
jgi:hypothetical protein